MQITGLAGERKKFESVARRIWPPSHVFYSWASAVS
jgi:hypothetical protein